MHQTVIMERLLRVILDKVTVTVIMDKVLVLLTVTMGKVPKGKAGSLATQAMDSHQDM